jgi:hypothetical protein
MHGVEQIRPYQRAGPHIALFWLRGTGLCQGRAFPVLPEVRLSACCRYQPAAGAGMPELPP